MKHWHKLFTNPLLKTLSLVALSVTIVSGVVYAAANSLAPTAPPSSTSYSLNDIYNKLVYGTEVSPGSGSLTTGSTMRSITEVYDAVDVFEARFGDEPLGQVIATGQTVSYTSGDDGDRQDGLARNYTDNNDGTVTDNNTGLMWKQCVEGRSGATCSGSQTGMNQATALSHCASLSFAGYSDWYLPNISELVTLVDYGVSSGARINQSFFPNTPTSLTWSSSTNSWNILLAWYVSFSHGNTSDYDRTNSGAVRCVRQN